MQGTDVTYYLLQLKLLKNDGFDVFSTHLSHFNRVLPFKEKRVI